MKHLPGMRQRLFGPNDFIYHEEDNTGNVNILWVDKLFYHFNREDKLARDIGIAIMLSIKVKWDIITSIFRVSKKTVSNIKEITEEEGIEGLFSYTCGRSRTAPEIKRYVFERLRDVDGKPAYQKMLLSEIDERYKAGEFKQTIKRSTLQNFVQEYRTLLKGLIKDDADGEDEPASHGDRLENEGLDMSRAAPESEREIPTNANIEFDVDCGGALAAAPFFHKLGMAMHIPETALSAPNGYANPELVFAYAFLNAAGAVSVEQNFKHMVTAEMGGVIGRDRMPCLTTLRERVPNIAGRMDMTRVMMETAKNAFALFSFTPVVYIDGHFMPYYGKTRTFKDYFPQRRLAMKGREYYFVHDAAGNPIFSVLSDGYQRMKHHILELDERLKELYGVGRKTLFLVFDRGGYSKDFCIDITNIIRFICWRTDPRSRPPADAKWREVFVEHQGNKPGKPVAVRYEVWERTIELKHENERTETFREIWIKKGKKESPAITNDFDLDLAEAVRDLTRRWGAQENPMKELVEHGINRIHSYNKEEFTEEHLYEQGLEERSEGIKREIDNPELKELKKRKSDLKNESEKLEKRIEKTVKKEATRDLISSIRRKLAGLRRRVKNLEEKILNTAKKVLLMDIIEEDDVVRLSSNKKLFFDWLKICAIWSKRSIVEIVKPAYGDMRDVNKFVDRILKSRTHVTIRNETMTVRFPKMNSKNEHKAMLELCKILNETQEIDLGLRFKRLVFQYP